jgi:hypothetical protein
MPTHPLPRNPDLSRLKRAAQRLLRDRARGDPKACQRLREFHPRLAGRDDDAIAAAALGWSDGLFAIAREHGFASWPRLKAHVEGPPAPGTDLPHHLRIADPVFRRAIELIDDGDEIGLAALLATHPGLAARHVTFEGGNYFRNPALIGFVAENPVRHDSLPPNILAIAQLILAAGGAADSAGLDEALALVASGRVPREAGVQIGLIDLFCDHGAAPAGAMAPALAHGEFAAAEALLRRGARIDLPAAAALGLETEAAALLPGADPASRHLALAYAAQHGRTAILDRLLDAGEDPSRYNPIGAHAHSTPLHQAVAFGHADAARLLATRGARLDLRDTLFDGTPADWAEYGGATALAAWLRGHEG